MFSNQESSSFFQGVGMGVSSGVSGPARSFFANAQRRGVRNQRKKFLEAASDNAVETNCPLVARNEMDQEFDNR